MIDIFYNGILAAIVLIWVMSARVKRLGRLIAALKRWGPALTVFLWAVFIVFVSWYAFNFDHFEDIHDIDEAVDTAVESVNDGTNPYEEYVVPRFKTKYRVDVDWTLGPYNYMPLDLFTYIGAEAALGSLGSPYWFVVANMIFAGLAMYMLRGMVRVPWLTFAPMAGIVMLFYSMDNASLTLLFMTGSMYALQSLKRHPEAVSLVIMGLAVLTKIYAAIPFLILLLFFLQSSASRRDWRRLSETVAAAGASAALAVLVMLPFGVSNVLDAAVFFHTSEEARVGTVRRRHLVERDSLRQPVLRAHRVRLDRPGRLDRPAGQELERPGHDGDGHVPAGGGQEQPRAPDGRRCLPRAQDEGEGRREGDIGRHIVWRRSGSLQGRFEGGPGGQLRQILK